MEAVGFAVGAFASTFFSNLLFELFIKKLIPKQPTCTMPIWDSEVTDQIKCRQAMYAGTACNKQSLCFNGLTGFEMALMSEDLKAGRQHINSVLWQSVLSQQVQAKCVQASGITRSRTYADGEEPVGIKVVRPLLQMADQLRSCEVDLMVLFKPLLDSMLEIPNDLHSVMKTMSIGELGECWEQYNHPLWRVPQWANNTPDTSSFVKWKTALFGEVEISAEEAFNQISRATQTSVWGWSRHTMLVVYEPFKLDVATSLQAEFSARGIWDKYVEARKQLRKDLCKLFIKYSTMLDMLAIAKLCVDHGIPKPAAKFLVPRVEPYEIMLGRIGNLSCGKLGDEGMVCWLVMTKVLLEWEVFRALYCLKAYRKMHVALSADTIDDGVGIRQPLLHSNCNEGSGVKTIARRWCTWTIIGCIEGIEHSFKNGDNLRKEYSEVKYINVSNFTAVDRLQELVLKKVRSGSAGTYRVNHRGKYNVELLKCYLSEEIYDGRASALHYDVVIDLYDVGSIVHLIRPSATIFYLHGALDMLIKHRTAQPPMCAGSWGLPRRCAIFSVIRSMMATGSVHWSDVEKMLLQCQYSEEMYVCGWLEGQIEHFKQVKELKVSSIGNEVMSLVNRIDHNMIEDSYEELVATAVREAIHIVVKGGADVVECQYEQNSEIAVADKVEQNTCYFQTMYDADGSSNQSGSMKLLADRAVLMAGVLVAEDEGGNTIVPVRVNGSLVNKANLVMKPGYNAAERSVSATHHMSAGTAGGRMKYSAIASGATAGVGPFNYAA